MARRSIHYEAAFEDYLRRRGIPYIAVDEAKRAMFAGSTVKSFDFLAYRPEGPNWLIDIKGRKFPYDTDGNRRYWENWVTQEDLADLLEWEQVFGDGFKAMLVFAYWMRLADPEWTLGDLHSFRGQLYAFLAIPVTSYKQQCVLRSPSWNTVFMPAGQFRAQVASF